MSDVVEIGMPKLSDSMEEATVLAWLKQPGEEVKRGEPLVEVETDKATVVYEAETNGVLEEVLVKAGEAAQLGAPIARLRVGGGHRRRRLPPRQPHPPRRRRTASSSASRSATRSTRSSHATSA